MNKKTEDVWIYQLEPTNTIIGIVFILLFTAFFVLFAIQNEMALTKYHYLFFVIGVALSSLIMTKKRVLKINRREKIIIFYSQVLFFKKNKIQPITDFDSIKISPKTVPVEEGYLDIVYSLVLSGSNVSREIISTPNEVEANKHLHEIAAFLNFRIENAIHQNNT